MFAAQRRQGARRHQPAALADPVEWPARALCQRRMRRSKRPHAHRSRAVLVSLVAGPSLRSCARVLHVANVLLEERESLRELRRHRRAVTGLVLALAQQLVTHLHPRPHWYARASHLPTHAVELTRLQCIERTAYRAEDPTNTGELATWMQQAARIRHQVDPPYDLVGFRQVLQHAGGDPAL